MPFIAVDSQSKYNVSLCSSFLPCCHLSLFPLIPFKTVCTDLIVTESKKGKKHPFSWYVSWMKDEMDVRNSGNSVVVLYYFISYFFFIKYFEFLNRPSVYKSTPFYLLKSCQLWPISLTFFFFLSWFAFAPSANLKYYFGMCSS